MFNDEYRININRMSRKYDMLEVISKPLFMLILLVIILNGFSLK